MELRLSTANHTVSDDKKVLKFTVELNEIRTQEIGTGANPRVQRETTPAMKAMIKTLKECPEKFIIYNKGITIIATSVRYEDGIAIIEYTENQGIVDGGHTNRAIHLVVADGHCSVTVIIATEEEAIDIAKYMNTTTAVTDQAIENLRGQFKWLLDSNLPSDCITKIQLDGCTAPYTYKITNIYQMLAIVCAKSSSDAVIAYSSVRKAFNAMTKNDNSRFKHVLKEIVHVYEIINLVHVDGYTDNMKTIYKTKAVNYPAWFNTSKYRLHGGLAMPIMYAFNDWFWDVDANGEYKLNRTPEEIQALLFVNLNAIIKGAIKICKRQEFSFNTAGKTEHFYNEVKALVNTILAKQLKNK